MEGVDVVGAVVAGAVVVDAPVGGGPLLVEADVPGESAGRWPEPHDAMLAATRTAMAETPANRRAR